MIRAAVVSDRDAVLGLLQQLAVSFAVDEVEFSRLFPAVIGDPSTVLLVEEGTTGVRGYGLASLSLLLYTGGLSAQLQEIVVDESARSHGIGGILLSAIENECRHRGARQLTVASRRASDYYSARGYAVTADFLKKLL